MVTMKKIVSVAVALVMLAGMTVNAFAAGFVPSIEVKNAPSVVAYMDDGKEIVGKIVDADGKVLSVEEHDCIIVTPVAEAQKDDYASEEVKNDLLNSYEDMKENGTKILDGLVDEGLVVRDMFAISSDCADLLELLPIEGNTLELKFDLDLGKEDKIQAVIRVNGTWEKLPVVNNGDGTVTATFEDLGIVAFLGKTTAESPDTGDHSGAELALWIGLMVVSAVAIVGLLIVVRRKKDEK